VIADFGVRQLAAALPVAADSGRMCT